MRYDRLYNFISPVTGKLPLDNGYILLGDKYGISFISPILIDVRQDIIDLKRKIGNFEELKKLDHNRIWIGDYTNEPVEQLHIGIINLPPLAEAVFPNPLSSITGDFRIPNPTFDYLSPFDWAISGPFLPQIYATKYDTLGNPTGADVSSTLAMTQIKAAQIMKRFDNANFIVGNSTVTFAWENQKMYLIPEVLKQLYGLGTTYTFTKAQSLGALETGLLKNTVDLGSGVLSKAESGIDYLPGISEPPLPDESKVLLYENQRVYSSNMNYTANDGNDVLSFKGGIITALNFSAKRIIDGENVQDASITAEGNIYAIETMGARRLILFDAKEIINSREDGVMLEGPPDLPINTMLKWIMPSAISTTNQVLADIGPNGVLLNERLLGFVDVPPTDAKYIIQSANDRLPNAQVLSELDDGFMYNTTGVISTILQPPLPSLAKNKLWIGDNSDKAIETQTINLENLPPLYQTIVPNPTTLDFVGQVYEGTVLGVPKVSNIVGDMFADIALINARFTTAKFVLNDGNVALQALMPASQFLSNVTSGLPIQISSNPLTAGKIEVAELPYNYLWVGDAQGRVSSQPNIILSNLPDLTNGKIWKGDINNRPSEADANYAPNDAKYILQTPDANLSNAQALNEVGLGIPKIVANGFIELAIAGDDYATAEELREYVEQAASSAEASATSAAEASTAALTATTAAEASATSAGLASTAAIAAGVSAGAALVSESSASSSASDASSSASDASNSASNASGSATNAANSATQAQTYLNTLLNTGLTLQGDVTGSGLLSNPIVTIFKPNPVFTGNEYIKIPVGNNLERPINSEIGMLRYNKEL